MASGYLCSDSAWMNWMPWVVLGSYVVIFGIVFFIRMLRPSGDAFRVRRARPIPVILGMAMAVGMVLYFRGRSSAFHTIDIADGKVMLGRFWPQKDVELSSGDVERISIVRGRHFYKGKRQGDHAWFNLRSGGTWYGSCESSDIPGIVAQARTVASTLGKPIDWKERCPDANHNAVVMSTEADVNAQGAMTIPAACSSAGK